MKWCSHCILPDSRPNLVIGDDGVCNACKSHGGKAGIDWPEREAAFRQVVDNAMSRATGYDCLIPVSGGKDSTWQVVKCLEYGLTPLAVTCGKPPRARPSASATSTTRRQPPASRQRLDHSPHGLPPHRRFAIPRGFHAPLRL